MSEQQPASSPPANRLYVGNIPWSTTVEELQALFADATSVEIPTVRVFVFVFCRRCCASFCFFIPGGSFKARAEKSDDDGDQNRESADSFDDGIRASNRRRRKHARRRVAGPPSLSLSLDGRRRKRRRRKRTARLESTRRLLYRKETQRDRRGARAFAFVVVVESPKKEKA